MRQVSFKTARKSDLVRQVLLDSLRTGELKAGEQLPTEHDMIDRFRVSRATVREAVTSLVHQGWLTRVQGKGTFVAGKQATQLSFAIVMPYLYFTNQPGYLSGTDVIPRLVQAIEGECRKTHSNILLLLANQDVALERENLTRVLETDIDAIILNYIGGSENRDCLQTILRKGIPLVMIDRYLDDIPTDYVVTDNARGSESIVAELVKAGFEQICYLSAPVTNSALRDRKEGYRSAMEQQGLIPRYLSVAEAGRLFAENPQERIAFVCCEAPLCAAIWKTVQRDTNQYHRLALACFDEPYIALPAGVTVVKVLQPLQEIGQYCIQLAKERVMMLHEEQTAERRKPEQVKLLPTVQIRSQTTGWKFQEVRIVNSHC